MDELSLLLGIVETEGRKILEHCQEHGKPWPSLNDPFDKSEDDVRKEDGIREAAGLVLAAARQLVASLEEPILSIRRATFGYNLSSALKAAVDFHVPEILDAAGESGLHISEISALTHADPGKLGRILRLLATNFFFREVQPDVFATNRLSSLLSTGKIPEKLVEDPSTKFDGTNGIAAYVSLQSFWSMQTAHRMVENMQDPLTAFSQQPDHSVFNRVFGTTLFELLSRPENSSKRKQFDISMSTQAALYPPNAIAQAFDWGSLPNDSVVVDVGGGLGGVTLEVIKSFPHLQGIIQDLSGVTENSKKWFKDKLPQAVESGRVTFESRSFFDPQPTRPSPPAVFMLRLIAHNWSDEYLIKILSHLRDAAGSNTYLLIQDNVLVYACPDPTIHKDVRIPTVMDPPSPLLSNMGQSIPYLWDILMMNNLNGQERTLRHFKAVLSSAGWKLVQMKQAESIGLHLPLLVSVPL